MLHLKKIADQANEIMECDFYIPIKVKFGEWEARREPHVFLGIGSSELLELGFGRETGAIGEITLVSVSTIKLRKKSKELNNIIEIKGLPLFSTKRWTPDDYYYLKEPRNFSFYLEDNCVIIELLTHNIASKIINNRFAFGFDKDNLLCTIEFRNMTTDEKKLLEEHYGTCMQSC